MILISLFVFQCILKVFILSIHKYIYPTHPLYFLFCVALLQMFPSSSQSKFLNLTRWLFSHDLALVLNVSIYFIMYIHKAANIIHVVIQFSKQILIINLSFLNHHCRTAL